MKALTLWRPWPYAICHLPPAIAKRVENRSWKPPAGLLGQRIAIHAGKRWDAGGAEFIARTTLMGSRSAVFDMKGPSHDEGIIGTAILKGVVTERDMVVGMLPLTHRTVFRWFSGPFGWLLDDVRALPEPIPCQGRQGLWDVPRDLLGRLS